ncbi:hypothetical protein HanPI659440_Chr13g0482121 [Helianthus annuus]|nr:hypothetical protein HanPI659440_Chr13g0482121 [Helianthus annuus]
MLHEAYRLSPIILLIILLNTPVIQTGTFIFTLPQYDKIILGLKLVYCDFDLMGHSVGAHCAYFLGYPGCNSVTPSVRSLAERGCTANISVTKREGVKPVAAHRREREERERRRPINVFFFFFYLIKTKSPKRGVPPSI